MKCKILVLAVMVCMTHVKAFSQTFKNAEKAKAFFERMDDEYNKAMVVKDSLVFVRHLAESYINCTPQGVINNKKNEIKTLLSGVSLFFELRLAKSVCR